MQGANYAFLESLQFIKPLREVVGDGIGHLFFVGAVEGEFELSALGGGERHDANDRFSVDLKAFFIDKEIGLEFAGKFYNGGGGTGMQPGAVEDSSSSRDHRFLVLAM